VDRGRSHTGVPHVSHPYRLSVWDAGRTTGTGAAFALAALVPPPLAGSNGFGAAPSPSLAVPAALLREGGPAPPAPPPPTSCPSPSMFEPMPRRSAAPKAETGTEAYAPASAGMSGAGGGGGPRRSRLPSASSKGRGRFRAPPPPPPPASVLEPATIAGAATAAPASRAGMGMTRTVAHTVGTVGGGSAAAIADTTGRAARGSCMEIPCILTPTTHELQPLRRERAHRSLPRARGPGSTVLYTHV
jgi:hypothetical protein